MLRLFSCVILGLLVSGCTSYGVVQNTVGSGSAGADSYSIEHFQNQGDGENSLILALSGGGTRAAALAYGVMQALRDTPVPVAGGSKSMLHEVDTISSVSGGSFTAAYYGLHGDKMFDDFEQVFLRQDVQGALLRRVLNPLRWFDSSGRTETAVGYYEETVFKGATYADMRKQGAPLIVINASDLGYGVRFSFVQEYFNLLCSDLNSFPVARAVTASSAVPVLFDPVVVQNFSDCGDQVPDWLSAAAVKAASNPELALVVEGLQTYFNREQRKYAHFVDGGITDNLGLRAVYEVVEVAGGAQETLKRFNRQTPKRLVLISVNASTDPEPVMDLSTKQPGLDETIAAMSDVQLHRYNVATTELLERSLKRWASELSTPERPVEPYFIRLGFQDIQEPERRRFFNRTPTSFDLSDEQVDRLIEAGGELLHGNREFQRLLADLEADRQAPPVR